MLGHATYPFTQQMASTTHRYSGTSSAFSASANPNEDWTKISDLAERRRIQNRIAQRNYRKKLKKRLEDLERRAASNSASPEQRPAELHRQSSPSGVAHTSLDVGSSSSNSSSSSSGADRLVRNPRAPHGSQSSQIPQHASQFLGATDDRVMFSQQFTRQLSTSPPPFSYSTYGAGPETAAYAQYAPSVYQQLPTTGAESLFSAPFLPPLGASASYPPALPSMAYAVKQDYYAEAEMSPFSMSYASMAGIDVPSTQAYQENAQMHTPPLSDSFEHSIAGSPPELYNPTTPASMPGTPPLRLM